MLLLLGMLALLPVAAAETKTVTMASLRDFERADGWTTWSPRPELAPGFGLAAGAGRNGAGALRIEGAGKPQAVGWWRRSVEGIAAGRTYRLAAFYRAEGVSNEQRSISARLVWLDGRGERL